MRGRRVSAAEAQAWGLLCEVVPRDGLGAAVASLADELAARPALALRTAKRVIGQAQDAPLSVAMELGGPGLRPAARHARLRRGRLGVRREAEAAVRGQVSGDGALRGRLGLLVAVALAALTLRPQLVGLGPVLPRAQHALGVSHSVASLLSTIPVIGMGVFAPAAAPLAARVGAIRAVTFALALIAGGGVARALAARRVRRDRADGADRRSAWGSATRSWSSPSRSASPIARCSSPASTRAASRSARRSRPALAVPLADAGDSWRAPMLVFSLRGRRLARLVARGDARRRAAPRRQARALPAAQAGRLALRRALRDLGLRLLRLRGVAARRVHRARLVGRARRPSSWSRSTSSRSSRRSR